MEENEVELIDYLKIIWKRKWFIIIPTLVCIIVAVVISFLLPQKWEVAVLIDPSKIFIKNEGGKYEEILAANPVEIASQINQASYNNLIAAELNLDIRGFPKLKAENLRGTNLIRISVRGSNVEEAKRILYFLFTHLKTELNEIADIEMNEIEAQIKSNEIKEVSLKKEIRAFKNKLIIVKRREKEIEQEITEAKKGIELLEKERRLILEKEKKNEAEGLAELLCSIEIQAGLRYQNTLNELLSTKRIEEVNINLEIGNKEETIKQIEDEINNLNERKGRIDFTELIKEPTASLSPVSPKKKLNIIIAGILGIMVFSMLAFFLEYVERQKG